MKFAQGGEGRVQLLQGQPSGDAQGLGPGLWIHRYRVVGGEVEIHEGGQVLEELTLLAGGLEGGGDVFRGETRGLDAGTGQGRDTPLHEPGRLHDARVFEVQGLELFDVELGRTAVDPVEPETGDQLGHRQELLPVDRRPPEQRQVVQHGLGREPVILIVGHVRPVVALGHLGTIRVQDEWDVRILWRFHSEGFEQGDVLGGVGQMVFTPDHMGDAHLQVIHHVDQVEHRVAVAAHEHPIGIGLFAIGERAQHITDDEVGNGDRLAGHAEEDRPVAVVGQALVAQFLDAPGINLAATTLEVGTAVAAARAGGVAGGGTFIPVEPQPAQPTQNDIDGLLAVALGVGVFDAQDEFPAMVTGEEPVEEGRAGPANVQVTRR